METEALCFLKQGLAFGASDFDEIEKALVPSILASTIQHLSGNPWITVDISATSFLGNNQIEWDWLTEGVDGNNKNKFWTQLKEAVQSDNYIQGLKIIQKHFQTNFSLNFVIIDDNIKTPVIINRLSISEAEIKSEDFNGLPKDFFEEYENSKGKIFILRKANYPARLIAPIQKLYPTKKQFGEKLIDVFGQIGLFRLANDDDTLQLENLEDLSSTTQLLNKITTKIERLAQSKNFSQILNEIFPNGLPSDYEKIIQELKNLETSLDNNEACELRIKLIHLITIELYYPVRQAVIRQKERQEAICMEAAERQEILRQESIYLQETIVKRKEELEKIDSQITESNEAIRKLEENKQTRKSELLAQLSEMEEREAFNAFIRQITNYDPKLSIEILESLKNLNYNSASLEVLVQSLVQIFKTPPPSQKLQNRISKQIQSDRQELIQALEVIKQVPLVEIDLEGDISVQGNNIILSSVLPQILQALQTSKPKQLKITCQESLVLDKSLEKNYFSGMNIILIANNVVAANAEITIDVSGLDGKSQEGKASNGVGDGADGQNGLDGIDGTHGGDVYIEALSSIVNESNIQINCKGGNGGNGQNGGDGTNGRKGSDGKDGDLQDPAWFDKYYAIGRGTAGRPGQEGGAAGLGGRGGCAGISGTAFIVENNGSPREIKFESATEGIAGKRGKPGMNGLHGKKGMDKGRAAKYMFQGWDTKTGYDLGIKEIRGVIYNGYELVEKGGPEIHKTQTTSRQNTREKKSSSQKQQNNEIKKQTISTMKNSILKMRGKTGETNSSASKNIQKELSLLSEASEISSKAKEIEQLQKLKSFTSSSLNESTQKHQAVNEEMSKAKEEQIQAELRSKEFEQVAINFREKQAEQLELSSKAQHLAQTEVESEVMVMKNHSASVEETDSPLKVSKVSNNLANLNHSPHFKLFLKLSENLKSDYAAVASLEAAMQIAAENIPGYEKIFIRLTQNQTYFDYIKNYLVEDTQAEIKFSHLKVKLPPNCDSLLDYLVKFRTRQIYEEIPQKKINNPEFCTFLDTLQIDTKSSYTLSRWVNQPNTGEKILTKMSPEFRKEFKQSVITQGKVIYTQMCNIFGKESKQLEGFKNFDEFLKSLIQFCEELEENKFKKGEIVSSFLKKKFGFDNFYVISSLSSILETSNMSVKSAVASAFNKYFKGRNFSAAQVLAQTAFLISHVHFKVEELSEITEEANGVKKQDDQKRQEKKKDTEITDSLNQLFDKIKEQYRNLIESSLSDIKSGIEKLQPEIKPNATKLFEKICLMIESPILNLSYSDRMENYNSIVADISLENLIKVSTELYPNKHGNYIKAGEFHFPTFHSYLTRKLSEDKVEVDKLNQILLHIQVGQLTKSGIQDFNKEELRLLEELLWESLSNFTNNQTKLKLIQKYQLAIEQSKSLEFETEELEKKCNVIECAEKFSKLLKRTLAYIPTGDTDSTITDAYKKRSQLKYLFLRGEYISIKTCSCGEVEQLENLLFETAINNVDEIIGKVEKWVEQLELTDVHFGAATNESRLEFLQSHQATFTNGLEIEYDLIFQSGLKHCSVLNDAKLSEEEKELLNEIIAKLIALKSNANSNQDTSGLKRVKDLFTFIQKRTPGYHPMQNLQQLHSQSYQLQMDRWRQLQSLLRKATTILNDFKGFSHSTSPLYMIAKFSQLVQSEVISKLNLHNVEKYDEILQEKFTFATKLNVDMECDEQIGVGKVARILQANSMHYPFTSELITLLKIEIPEQSKVNRVAFDFLKSILDVEDMEFDKNEWPRLWAELTSMFTNFEKTAMYKFKSLKLHLAAFLVKLKYEDSRRPFVLRLVQNLSADKHKKVDSELDSTLSSSELYSLLIPKHKLEEIFLHEKETQIYHQILKLEIQDKAEFETEINNIICCNHPQKWLGLLERLYFNKTFRIFAAPSSKNLEERDTLKDIVFQATLKTRGKRILRAIQQTHTYNEFKLSYLLQENESNRFKWLIVFNKMLSKIGDGQEVFSSVRDCKTFLTFIRDIDLGDFEVIVENRFPQNWLMWVLIKCLAKDIHKLPGRLPAANIEDTLVKVLSPIKPAKIKLLLILHPLLRSGNEEYITKQMILSFLEGIAKANFTESKLTSVNYELTLCPFSYWNRVVRIHSLSLKCQNYPTEIVEMLLGMDERFGESIVDVLISNVLETEGSYLIESEKLEILSKFNSTEWILDEKSLKELKNKNYSEITKLVTDYSENAREKELSLEEIIDRLAAHPINQRRADYKDFLAQIKIKVEKIHKHLNEDFVIPEKIPKLNFEEQMKKFLKSWKSKYGNWEWNDQAKIDQNLICYSMALLYRGVQFHFSSETKIMRPRNTQIISVLLLIDGIARNEPMGKLGEIETGEGKTCIVAMFAAFCALLKANVHVITSNKLLAQDGANEAAGFFQVLGLAAGNNCDKDCLGDSERKKRYDTNNVVYGELAGFQADILNTDFHDKEILTKNKRADIVIVDEVDSLLLDKGSHMLYLSHGIPELKYLRPIFLVIWRAVMFHEMNKNKTKAAESDVHSVRVAVEKQIKEFPQEVKVPECLKDFVSRRMGVWVKQAFIARFMPINEDFIVEEGRHKIVNMDNDTGVEQGNMHMSLGLHQFLQLKYKMKLSPESLKCVFMSNNKFFKDQKGKIFGITGTLGGEEETNLVGKTYGVEFFAMPRYKLNKRVEEREIIVEHENEWLEKIRDSIEDHKEGQPILVISENIAQHEKIKEIIQTEVKEVQIHEYTSSERHTDFIKELKEGPGLDTGAIVLSTNLGGRGTDLKVHDDCKKLGLHVILTFLPKNLRVEKQAFGRTARAGENGTVQFILCSKSKSKRTEGLKSLYELKEERRRMESKRLQAVETREMKKINVEDNLFSQYQEFVKKQIQSSTHFTRHKKRVRVLQLEFLNNRWAVWLDSIRDQLDILHLQRDLGEKAISRHFEQFKESMLSKLRNTKDFTMFAEFTSEFQKLAIVYEKIAIKSLFSSVLSGDWTDAGEISSEWGENIKAAWNEGWSWTKAAGSSLFKLDAEPLKKMFTELNKRLNAESPPSDIDIGVGILNMALDKESEFSQAASVYLGTMKLQKEPTDRSNAKKAIKEGKKKIIAQIELNNSALSILDEACAKIRTSNGTATALQQNKFREQILCENNLLHIHLDALNYTLHSPITPNLLKTQIKEIDTEERAEKLQNLLLDKKWDLLQSYRVSKTKSLEFTDESHPTSKLQIPCILSNLEKFFKEKREYNSDFSLEDLKPLVVTKQSFLQHLLNTNMATNTEEFMVTVNEISKEDFEKHKLQLAEFPDDLIMFLFEHANQVYLKDKIKEVYPDIDCENLTRILQENKWIKSTTLPLKATETLGNVIQTQFIPPEDLESYDVSEEVLKYKETEMFKTYIRLVTQKHIREFGPLSSPDDTIQHPIPQEEGPISYSDLPFPDTVEEGAKDLLQAMVSCGIIKEPRVKFPSIWASAKEIEEATKKMKGTFSSESFRAELKCLYEEAVGEESKFESFVKSIQDLLLDSVGSLKRYAKIRVNYESIASRVPMDSGASNEELEELIREGIFDRIIIFDELVRFYENTGAWLVLAIGIAEIGCGVALEFVTGGLLSPLASFLISEGSSDVMYSIKHLYKGNRVEYGDYKEYKLSSMKYSALTMGTGFLFTLGSPLVAIALEFAKAGVKQMALIFIEGNIRKAIQNNILGLKALFDGVFESEEVKFQIEAFKENGINLWKESWEQSQAENIISKIVRNIAENAGESSFSQDLEKTGNDLKWTLREGLAKSVAKRVLPTNNRALRGYFGSNKRLGDRCTEGINGLILSTMERVNQEIFNRTMKLNNLREKYVYLNDKAKGDKSSFEHFLKQETMTLKEGLRQQIVAHFYEQLSSQKMTRALYETIRSGYSVIIQEHEISLAKTREEQEDWEKFEKTSSKISREQILMNQMMEEEVRERVTIVANAQGRSVAEVKTIWKGLGESAGDIEFFNDLYGNCFACLRSDESIRHSFVLSKDELAFDNYLSFGQMPNEMNR